MIGNSRLMIAAIIICAVLGIALLALTFYALKSFLQMISNMINTIFQDNTLSNKSNVEDDIKLPNDIYTALIVVQNYLQENDGKEFLALDLSHFEDMGIIGISVGSQKQLYLDNIKKLFPNQEEEETQDLLNDMVNPFVMGYGIVYCYEDGLWDYQIF